MRSRNEEKARRRKVKKLVAQLGLDDLAKRSQAEAELYELGSETTEDVVSELGRMVRNAKRLPWTMAGFLGGSLLILSIGCYLRFDKAPSWLDMAVVFVAIGSLLNQFQRGRNGAAKILANGGCPGNRAACRSDAEG